MGTDIVMFTERNIEGHWRPGVIDDEPDIDAEVSRLVAEAREFGRSGDLTEEQLISACRAAAAAVPGLERNYYAFAALNGVRAEMLDDPPLMIASPAEGGVPRETRAQERRLMWEMHGESYIKALYEGHQESWTPEESHRHTHERLEALAGCSLVEPPMDVHTLDNNHVSLELIRGFFWAEHHSVGVLPLPRVLAYDWDSVPDGREFVSAIIAAAEDVDPRELRLVFWYDN